MKMILSLSFILPFVLAAQQTPLEKLYNQLPDWSVSVLKKEEITKSYQVNDSINPFYLEGDFNGDNLSDIAVFITNNASRKEGILIVHQGNNEHFIFGAGKDFGMGDDMNWIKYYKVYREKNIRSFKDGKNLLVLKYPAIRLIKNDSISCYIYWAGKKYKSFNQVY